MRETHGDPHADESGLMTQTSGALLPWHSTPRIAFEQLSFATTDGSLALAAPVQAIIVIAESDPVMARALQDELRDLAGWQTLVAPDAQTARNIMTQTQPRLILLDIELTGVDFYAQLRARSLNLDTHIIYVTSATSYHLHQLGAHEGVLLRKPYDPRDLAGIIRALLEA
jgi:CheY-like chemotaxis protein